jgi:hypothetical protein
VGVAGPIALGHLADAKGTYRSWLTVALMVPIAAFIPLELGGGMPVALVSIGVLGFMYRSSIPSSAGTFGMPRSSTGRCAWPAASASSRFLFLCS